MTTMHGRGSNDNPQNKYLKDSYTVDDSYLEFCYKDGENPDSNKTEVIEVFPKTMLNKVKSPDVGMAYSVNPYQGCEHGCIYCYARTTHEYWGYSSGLDFERKIMVKPQGHVILTEELSKKSYKPDLVMLSGNTDCYQPIERHLKLTRKLLTVFLELKHPVGIITKNSLILRDLDILKELNRMNLLRITLSITSLSEETRRVLEPRTSSVKNKLHTLKVLADHNIPVNVNMAPVIPWINDHEILKLVRTVGELGARSVAYILVRLNGPIGGLFEQWLDRHYPDRKDRVLNTLRDCRAGKIGSSVFGERMSGTGNRAVHLKRIFELAKSRYIRDFGRHELNFSDFQPISKGQLKLF